MQLDKRKQLEAWELEKKMQNSPYLQIMREYLETPRELSLELMHTK
jgi:hypothetical protein